MSIVIEPFTEKYAEQVAQLIIHIQRNEFQIPITLNDQPDLANIPAFYQQAGGNFWCALNERQEVVGTIGLINTGTPVGAIRKMFVRADYRGSEKNIAGQLLHLLENFALAKGLQWLYLGTVPPLKAAQRFYEKNGYHTVAVSELPPAFPRMPVDTLFYRKQLSAG